MKKRIASVMLTLFLTSMAFGISSETDTNSDAEFNPFALDAEKILGEFDEEYQRETGISPFPLGKLNEFFLDSLSCYRQSCPVWALVSKSNQRLYLYLNGIKSYEWKISTGDRRHTTPNIEANPNGRIYTKYSSKRYPGGNYNGLGNMPYAVFIKGGIAIHGTPRNNWAKLGNRASHGCIRLLPDNAEIFRELVLRNGLRNVWVSVSNEGEYNGEPAIIASIGASID